MATAAKGRVAVLVGVALTGAVLLLMYFVAWEGDEPRLDRGEATTAPVESSETRSRRDGPEDGGLGVDAREALSSDSADVAGAATRALDVPDFVETVGPTITLVERESGKPLPDAGVWWLARDEVDEAAWPELLRGGPEREEQVERHGHAVELDGLATAELPWRAGWALLHVRSGDRQAWRPIDLSTRTRLRIALSRRVALTIRTVDENGRPIRDVPLALVKLAVADGAIERCLVEPIHLFATTTDRDGEAACARGSLLLDESLDGDGLATRRAIVAALAFPCRDRLATPVDPRDGCAEPLLLRPPPMAALRLRAALASGGPCLVPLRVTISCANPAEDVVPTFVATLDLPPGGAIEPVVEAGVDFAISAVSLDQTLVAEPVVVRSDGVASTKEQLLLVEPAPPPPPTAPLLVLGPEGEPLRTAEVAWQYANEVFFPAGLVEGRTDEGGLLRIRLGVIEGARALQLFAGLVHGGDGGARLRGSIDFPSTTHEPDVLLGRVQLERVAPLVSGRVVDSRGAGLPGAWVRLVDEERAWMDGAQLRQVEEQIGERLSWFVVAGERGRFEIVSPRACERLRAKTTRSGWWHAGAEKEHDGSRYDVLEAGDDRAVLLMKRDGRLRGRLEVEPGMSIARLDLRTHQDFPPLRRVVIGDDGRFEIEGVAGRFTLQVVSKGDPAHGRFQPAHLVRPLAEVVGLEFVEDHLATDPRIDPIDLRKLLMQVDLVANSTEGGPVAGARLFLASGQDQVVELSPRCDLFGRARVAVPLGASRLLVGTRERTFQFVRFDLARQELQLPPAAQVQVVLTGVDQPLRETLATLRLARSDLGRIGASVALLLGPIACRVVGKAVGERMTLEAPAPLTGEWSVEWREGDADFALLSKRFTVAPGARQTIVEIALDDRDRARIAALRRRRR